MLITRLNKSTPSDTWIEQQPEIHAIEDTEKVANEGNIHD
jgi:hypothetical protein